MRVKGRQLDVKPLIDQMGRRACIAGFDRRLSPDFLGLQIVEEVVKHIRGSAFQIHSRRQADDPFLEVA